MKTKPFNLEEALNGSKVVTRDGCNVNQLTFFENAKVLQLVGVFDDGTMSSWRKNGMHTTSGSRLSDKDLVIVVNAISAWVNVYIDDNKIWLGHTYPSKEEAIEKITNRCTYIKTIEITDEL